MKGILDGKKLSEKIQEELKPRIKMLISDKIRPGLGVILVGDNLESETYVNMKHKTCLKLGILSKIHRFSKEVDETLVIETIERMNQNLMIHGILVQLPLPKHFNTNKILNTIHPTKDVDGMGTMNAGKLFQNQEALFYSCTPRGCIELLDEYNIRLRGRNITIIGSSNLVGLPLSMMLLNKGATVTICNINTRDIREHIQHADILITCCGVPHIIKEEWVNEGTIVIDIGINKVEDSSKKNGYRLVGDVDFENVKNKASYITPVPGGVGPMTIAILMKQIVESCESLQMKSKI
tara:strand:+ start:2596 stop:3477 length:882 start_codon:yes stop_codon:yes gene_type:complete